MAEKRTKVQVPGGGVADAVEVPVKECQERWTEIQLEDGTVIRIRTVVLNVLRIEGQFDQENNPMYQVKANQIMTVDAPEHLKKGAAAATTKAN